MRFENILNEISQIALIKCVTALSRFLQRPIGIESKKVEICSKANLHINLNCPNLITSTFIPISGNILGGSLLIYSQASALEICDLILNKAQGQTNKFGESEVAVLTEIANVCLENFLISFTESLRLSLLSHNIAIFDNGCLLELNEKIAGNLNRSLGHENDMLRIILKFQLDHDVGTLIIWLGVEKIYQALDQLTNLHSGMSHWSSKLG